MKLIEKLKQLYSVFVCLKTKISIDIMADSLQRKIEEVVQDINADAFSPAQIRAIVEILSLRGTILLGKRQSEHKKRFKSYYDRLQMLETRIANLNEQMHDCIKNGDSLLGKMMDGLHN